MNWIVFVFIVFLGLIALSALAGAVGYSNFRAQMKKEVAIFFHNKNEAKTGAIKEEDLEELPDPVKRYLKFTQIVGNERMQSVRLKMKGQFRLKPDQRWFPLMAEEYYTTDPPSLVWFGRIFPFPMFSVTARDRYFSGKGRMRIKLMSLFSVADANGKDMNQAALVRYLNEMMWFPSAYLGENIRWEAIDSSSARIFISDKGLAASAVCFFSEKGEMVDFVADRLNAESGKNEEWHTPIYEYGEFNGIKIPVKGEALYRRSSGDFSYIRLEITDIEYNVNSTY